MQDARWTLILSPIFFPLRGNIFFHLGTMSDIKGIRVRQPVTPEQQDQKLRDVAQQYEKHFLRELVKSMRSTVSDGGLIEKSQAEKIFSEQLDEQYVEQWGGRGGIGLADMIHSQLIEKFGVQMGLKAPANSMRGPVPFQAKDKANLGFKATQSPEGINFKFKDLNFTNRDLTNPFDGKVSRLEQKDGLSLLGIDHDNGLRSLLKFPTPMSSLAVTNIGEPVRAGQSLGQWSAKAGDLDWQIEEIR